MRNAQEIAMGVTRPRWVKPLGNLIAVAALRTYRLPNTSPRLGTFPGNLRHQDAFFSFSSASFLPEVQKSWNVELSKL